MEESRAMKVSKRSITPYPSPDDWLLHRHPRLWAKLHQRRCGAHCKSTGMPCQAKAMVNGRCRYHGGLSTGPKTEEGRRRALANLRQYGK